MLLAGTPVKITATGLVVPRGCTLIGILTTASTSGTLNLADSPVTGGTNIFTTALSLTAGQFTPLYMQFATGIWATVGGTLEAYAIIQQNA